MASLLQGVADKVVVVAVGRAAVYDVMVVVAIVTALAVIVVTTAVAVVVVGIPVVAAVAFVIVGYTNLAEEAVVALRTHEVSSADNHGHGGHISALLGLLMQTLRDYSVTCARRKDYHSAQVCRSVVFEVCVVGDEWGLHQYKFCFWEERMTSLLLLLHCFPFQKPEKQYIAVTFFYSCISSTVISQ